MIRYSRQADKFLNRQSLKVQARLVAAVEEIDAGTATDIKPLKGKFSGMFRKRVGDYRIIFTREGVILLVVNINHRQGAY